MKMDEKQRTNYEKLRKLWKTNAKQKKNMKNHWTTLKTDEKLWKLKITMFQGPTSHRSLLNRSLKTLKNIE